MAEHTTLARPYARAAFESALAEQGSGKAAAKASSSGLAKWQKMLHTAAVAAMHEKMAAILRDPSRTGQQAAEALVQVCGKDLNPKGRNFIHLLAENKRLPLLPEIASLFAALKAAHEEAVDVRITTAFKLAPAMSGKLEKALSRRLKRQIRLSTGVDPALIGGAVIRAGDSVIDDSVRGKLARLATAMNG